MRYKKQLIVITALTAIVVFIRCSKGFESTGADSLNDEKTVSTEKTKSLITQGKEIFRFDDFGDKDFWSGLLHIDKAILGANNGGFGPGVSPATALAVGLKVDVDALPAAIRNSKILSGNDLGMLADVEQLPDKSEIRKLEQSVEVQTALKGGETAVHVLAKKYLAMGQVNNAWGVLLNLGEGI